MSVLSPAIFAAALAATALPIVLLHLLRLRRRPLAIPSTLLWRRTVEDLLANAPFQRLRLTLLLLLQLLAATAIAVALGRPASSGAAPLRGRVIVLIDRSASMNARDGSAAADGASEAATMPSGTTVPGSGSTRLDAARSGARELIERLGADSGAEIMLIAFARRPTLLVGFEGRPAPLLEALDALVPTDEEADLDAALELVDAFAQPLAGDAGGDGRGEETAEPLASPPALVLFTDGNVRPSRRGTFTTGAGSVAITLVGSRARSPRAPASLPPDPRAAGGTASTSANLGVVALAAERRYEDPATVALFARLVNSGPEDVEAPVTLRADSRTLLRRNVVVPAASEAGVGEAILSEELELPGSALVVIEQSRPDALPTDDVAAAFLPEVRALRIGLVAPDGGDPFLRTVLEALAGAPPRALEPGTWQGAEAATDLLVFDRVAPERMPAVASLTIGATPPWLAARPPAGGGRRVLGWDRSHPLLRHVDLDDLVYADSVTFDFEAPVPTPASAPGDGAMRSAPARIALVQGADGPVLAAADDHGVRHAALAPALRRSNLPALPAFPVFLQNAVDWLAAGGAGQRAIAHRPGDVVTVLVLRGSETVEMAGPGPEHRSLAPGPGDRRVALPDLERVGIRTLTGVAPAESVIAVSQLSELESDLRPQREPAIAIVAPARRGSAEVGLSDLWPWAVGLALILLVLEWMAWLVKAGR